MSDNQPSIAGSVGTGGSNGYIDICSVQLLLNVARNRINVIPIGVDGDIGPETIGAIRDFQTKSFGAADGRVDVNGRSYKRLVEIYSEPILISPNTYTRGRNNRYRVTVGNDGRIFVQPNDSLSKYSAAIYGDYWHISDFRKMIDGKFHFLRNVNLIRSGEVLYHIPTWLKFMEGKTKVTPPLPPPLLPSEKEKISMDAVKADFHLKGDYGLKMLNGIGTALDWGSGIVEGFSVVVESLGTASTILGILNVPFSIYGNIRDLANSSDLDLRMYGMRAAAYATTAWAFNETIPTGSPEILSNYRAAPSSEQRMQQLAAAWRVAADAATAAQEQFAREQLGQTPPDKKKIAWQAALRALGDNDKGKLSILLMKSLGEVGLDNVPSQTSRTIKEAWERGYNTPYPR